jgi:hypothetical protein
MALAHSAPAEIDRRTPGDEQPDPASPADVFEIDRPGVAVHAVKSRRVGVVGLRNITRDRWARAVKSGIFARVPISVEVDMFMAGEETGLAGEGEN